MAWLCVFPFLTLIILSIPLNLYYEDHTVSFIIAPMEALELTKGRVSLLGGLSPLDLKDWTEEETYNNCTEVLKSFGGNNKFVLAAGGSVNQVPIANLKAMFKAADDYKI